MKRYSILQRYKSRGNTTWYGRISCNGIIRYVSLGVTRKADAQEWLNRQNALKFLPESMQEEKKDVKLSDAVNHFLDFVSSSHGTVSLTFKAYATKMKNLTAWGESHGVLTLRELTREKASRFALSINSEYSSKTAREILRVSKQFCKWCSDTYELDGWSPFLAVKASKIEKRRKDFWTVEQIERILDAAPTPRFRLFWSLMAFAGLRQAEACSFGPCSLTEDGKLHVVGKGNKEAFLPVSERLRKEIERYGELHEGMFDEPQFKYSRSNAVIRDAVSSSGIASSGESTNHRFRHSFASNLIRAGVNIKAVQQLMRHEKVQITLDTYSHLLQDDLTEAANALK
ncbi:tyrosine-type recombinase/integrase [Fibrobacter sp. UWH4]|uniref:tyrosine-type recombinase/integrase n=1 Tax=Fibrobacter sp. UWH4 TaxID=1896210 RepID=UPI0015875ABA|nr:tyrosine-type recombinase/integrase [Fibrobacter sp. UWH4]